MTTWNPSDKSANIVLSNGNLTAGCNSAVDGAVRSTTSKSSGKFYFEYTPTFAGADTGVGIATASASLSGIGPNATGAAIVYASGSIYYNGSSSGVNMGVPGSRIDVAVDVTGSRIWFRGNGTGNWNGNASFDPAAGTGGLNINTLFPANAVYAAVCENSTSASFTINFGATAFGGAIPSGFSRWDPLAVTDMQATQLALEQWASIIPPDMQATQVALEMWVSNNVTDPQMIVTQAVLEMWASVAQAAAAQQARAMILA